MKKVLILIFLLPCILLINLYSQIVTVVDSEDFNPVAEVAVTNESGTKFIYTNRSGKADISAFGEKDLICFHHFTFERLCLSIEEINKSNYEIKLFRKLFVIEEFVISANRWEQNKTEVPNKITSILKPLAELQNPQTAADLLAISDEVFIQKSQLGGGSPMISWYIMVLSM